MAARSKKDSEDAKQVINIKGNVSAGRDVIQRDQTNIITNTSTQIANLASPAAFVSALQQVQAQLAGIKQAELSKAQVRNLEVVEGLVLEVSEEAQKPQPVLERIQGSLAEAKETLELLACSLVAASALGTTLGGLAVAAIKLFGG
jgi:chaperonin GroEL (HSP60 family)